MEIMLVRSMLPIALITLWATQPAPVPAWAQAAVTRMARVHELVVATASTSATLPLQLAGDFDCDGAADLALLVERRRDHRRGILLVHRGRRAPVLLGAGVEFGNGGDDFGWMDAWHVEPPRAVPPRSASAGAARCDALVVEKMESASARIAFSNGRYRWRQLGD
jgi:hypothetical protein